MNRICFPVALGILLCCVYDMAYSADPVDEFLAAPDYRSSTGNIIFRSNGTNAPPNMLQHIAWSNADFVSEYLREGTAKEIDVLNQNLVLSSGRYHGTNWQYRNHVLTIEQSPGEAEQRVKNLLGGMKPDEHFLSTILGRGFTLDELAALKKESNSILSGKYQLMVPIKCQLLDSNGIYTAEFELKTRYHGNVTYKRIFSLIPFSPGTYIPNFLQSHIIGSNLPPVTMDVNVLFATNDIENEILSPWDRYGTNELRFRNGGDIYAYVYNRQTRSNTLTRIPRASEAKPEVFKIHHRNLQNGAFIVVGLVSVSILCFMVYRTFIRRVD